MGPQRQGSSMDPKSRLVRGDGSAGGSDTSTKVSMGAERPSSYLVGPQVSILSSVRLEVGHWLEGGGQKQKGTPVLSLLHDPC